MFQFFPLLTKLWLKLLTIAVFSGKHNHFFPLHFDIVPGDKDIFYRWKLNTFIGNFSYNIRQGPRGKTNLKEVAFQLDICIWLDICTLCKCKYGRFLHLVALHSSTQPTLPIVKPLVGLFKYEPSKLAPGKKRNLIWQPQRRTNQVGHFAITIVTAKNPARFFDRNQKVEKRNY